MPQRDDRLSLNYIALHVPNAREKMDFHATSPSILVDAAIRMIRPNNLALNRTARRWGETRELLNEPCPGIISFCKRKKRESRRRPLNAQQSKNDGETFFIGRIALNKK